MVIMRPNEHSKSLAMMQQIGADGNVNDSAHRDNEVGEAEAVTEQPDDDHNSIELSDFGTNNKKKQQ